jgi:tetratricopeptide (TPR) repeat protein
MNKINSKTIFGQIFFIGISLIVLSNLAAAQNTLSADDYFRRGVKKVEAKNCEEAIKDFNEAIRLNGNEPRFFKERGGCFLTRLGEFEKSLADLNKAIELKPDYAEAYLSRATAYMLLPEKNGSATNYDTLAKADFDKAIELNPKHYKSYFARAFFLLGKEKPLIKEGLADLAKAIEINPKGEDAYILRMYFYRSYGDYDKAIADATVMTKNLKSAVGFFERGKLYSEIGKYEEAIADFTKSLKRDPNNRQALNGRAFAYQSTGQFELAKADRLQADKLEKQPAEISFKTFKDEQPKPLTDAELTDSYLEMSKDVKPERANEEWDKIQIKRLTAILEAEPQLSAAFFQRGRVYGRLKEYEKAIADYSQVIKFDPQDFRAFNNRGAACARVGNYERAIADFARAMSINSNQSASLYNFALALFNQGLPNQAVKIFSLYLTKEPKNVNAYRLRAKAYRQLGKTAEAEADEKKIKILN